MFKKINTKFENIFSPTLPHLTDLDLNLDPDLAQKSEQIQDHFLINKDIKEIENLSYIFSYAIDQSALNNLFMQLSSYFEIGFLLQKNQKTQTSHVIDAFSFFQKIEATGNIKKIKLPDTEIYNILSTKASSLLNHFKMNSLDPDEKMVSYLIPISTNHFIIIMTQTAEPWARIKIETLQKTLMKINFSL